MQIPVGYFAQEAPRNQPSQAPPFPVESPRQRELESESGTISPPALGRASPPSSGKSLSSGLQRREARRGSPSTFVRPEVAVGGRGRSGSHAWGHGLLGTPAAEQAGTHGLSPEGGLGGTAVRSWGGDSDPEMEAVVILEGASKKCPS